jgi:hypothetical protein
MKHEDVGNWRRKGSLALRDEAETRLGFRISGYMLRPCSRRENFREFSYDFSIQPHLIDTRGK